MQMSFLAEVRSLGRDILWFLHSMVVYCIRATRKRLCDLLSGKGIVECRWKKGFALIPVNCSEDLPWIHRRFIVLRYADRVVQDKGAALRASSDDKAGEG